MRGGYLFSSAHGFYGTGTMTSPRLARTIQTPSPISSLAFGTSGHVFAGSGTLIIFDS